MAPNAGDRHFRVFRVPASVFQVPVGGDGRPLADVLRGERAPMDALHRRPEAAIHDWFCVADAVWCVPWFLKLVKTS